MPLMTAVVDIGLGWPAGTTRNVEDHRAALLTNSGWAKPARKPRATKGAKSATTKKAS